MKINKIEKRCTYKVSCLISNVVVGSLDICCVGDLLVGNITLDQSFSFSITERLRLNM